LPSNLGTISGNFSFQNDMMNFSTYADFKSYTQSIRVLAENESNIQIADSILQAQNSTTVDFENYPVLGLIESNFSFTSFRIKHQELHYNSLDSPDIYNSFILDPYIESCINQFGEIKIGSLYLRFIDKDINVLVSDNDYAKFIATRNIVSENLQDDYNLKIFDMTKQDISDVFTFAENDARAALKPIIIPQFTYTKLANNYYHFNNISFIHTENAFSPLYKWRLSNGYEYIGTSIPDILISENQLPLSMELSVVNSPIQTDTFQMNIIKCNIPFTYTQNGATITIDVRNSPDIPNGCIVEWDFGDGYSATGAFVTHTYAFTPWVIQKRLIEISGKIVCNGVETECVFYRCIKLRFNCENQKIVSKNFDKTFNGSYYRLTGSVWATENFIHAGVGTSSEALVKINGKYEYLIVDKLYTNTDGLYYSAENFCCTAITRDNITEEKKTAWTIINRGVNKPRYVSQQLWSNHKMTYGNLVIDSNGKLYLQ